MSRPVKALVTGGAGFIGLHLARALAGAGQEVHIADNLSRGQEDAEFREFVDQPRVSFHRIDLTDRGACESLDRDYDHVYHLAAVNGTRYFYEKPQEVLRVNTLSTIHILDWFIDNPCGKILFGSTSETYAGLAPVYKIPYPTPEEVPLGLADVKNPRWSYGGSKLVGELFFLNYGRMFHRRTGIARFTNVYGPRMGHEHVIPEFLDRIRARQDPFTILGAEPTRTFCYVEDAVRATRLVMESPATDHDVVNVGSDHGEITMRALAELMFDLFDFHPRLDVKPAPLGSVPRRCPDIGKVRKLGYEPRVNLEAGLRMTQAWYQEHSNAR